MAFVEAIGFVVPARWSVPGLSYPDPGAAQAAAEAEKVERRARNAANMRKCRKADPEKYRAANRRHSEAWRRRNGVLPKPKEVPK